MAHAFHPPRGFPRCDCGVLANSHYVEHKSQGDPCRKCSMPAKNHRERKRERSDRPPEEKPSGPNRKNTLFIGIDGEGADTHQGYDIHGKSITLHDYFLLAASFEDGRDSWHIYPEPGKTRLSTVQCLDFILDLPKRKTKVFSFAFNYDLTKILEDVDDKSLFYLFRPELRQRKDGNEFMGPEPVYWNGYLLNLQGTKFSVKQGKRRIVIWDLFKFFQGKFVTALKDWKVGDSALWTRMQLMKDKRNSFTQEEKKEILEYCLEETRCMGQLARKLIESHEAVGLKLKNYFGAGSSGGAMLDVMGIKEKLAPTPKEMETAVFSAFSGGRFENSGIGDFDEPLNNWDIASAYVYQLRFLPCLEHASWRFVKKRKDLEEAQGHALVNYTLGSNPKITGWGPFPFRTEDGTIAYPIESGGGWVWLQEYLEGERLWPHVHFKGAWIYSNNCDTFKCSSTPFAKIPEYFQERLRIGKEGPGLVIKLGMNSCYGKLAQSVGKPEYNSWIWAGMITSGCRAQLLQLYGLHKNPEDVLMMATDGLLTRDRTVLPPSPLPTGTGGMFNGEMKQPLGGWEKKDSNKGMFIARPGIYFPLNPTEKEIAQVRARGVGRSIVLEYWKKIVDVWNKDGIQGIAVVDHVPRFCGGKTSIHANLRKGTFHRANHQDGVKPRYGQWISREVGMSFDPMPKRESLHPDGKRLILRRFPKDLESKPYNKAVDMFAPESIEMQMAAEEMEEQPEHDFKRY